ncbi:MAG: tRNA uridine-5-carboxymethylaminomethyl(34) synthesis GTPase MnmE [Alphaproteobacteria bacterium]|nr:tRNA uridine-5-carboxymethylaminomethyl(34) synthesis GTPase MnmE [Alphaproteobacteria bacterium]
MEPNLQDTIIALSSGRLPSGVGVIRISGPRCRQTLKSLIGDVPGERRLVLRDFCTPDGGVVIDRGLAVFFPGPKSFTGLDCAELHCHGGKAVVARLLGVLVENLGCRLAEAGEFTRQAFENGRLDLTEVEGLGDLLAAETENQRVLALTRSLGGMSARLGEWREEIVVLQAEIEACLDFSDEGDVPGALGAGFDRRIREIDEQIEAVISQWQHGRMVREGIRVTIAGAPNAGKSTLLNHIANSEVAIVSEVAGTTRDVLEVPVDLDGQLFLFADTAGLRNSADPVEIEGMRRARGRMAQSDLVIALRGPGDQKLDLSEDTMGVVWTYTSKIDVLRGDAWAGDGLSAVSGEGMAGLFGRLSEFGRAGVGVSEPIIVARERDKHWLKSAQSALRLSLGEPALELRAESLRRAALAIGRLTGQIDAEEVLDQLFSHFCIGK